jgi:NTP pyrophosphatase (non-canonical NTP hydrolase)
MGESLTFDEYQVAARETAIYPRDAAILYPTLGLAGEVGEVAEKIVEETPELSGIVVKMTSHAGKAANQVKKILRDDACELTEERAAAIGKEIGGVLWYAADLAFCIGLNLGDIARENLDVLASRQERGTLQGDGDDR